MSKSHIVGNLMPRLNIIKLLFYTGLILGRFVTNAQVGCVLTTSTTVYRFVFQIDQLAHTFKLVLSPDSSSKQYHKMGEMLLQLP